MVAENITGQNPFAGFAGFPPLTPIPEAALRCQGPFAHPILAGTFGATLFPLFLGLSQREKGNQLLSILAVLSCGAITFTSGSSGPVLALFAGLLALAFWPLRSHMSVIRWAI